MLIVTAACSLSRPIRESNLELCKSVLHSEEIASPFLLAMTILLFPGNYTPTKQLTNDSMTNAQPIPPLFHY